VKRTEITILIFFVATLVAVNVVNYFRRERMKRISSLVVEQGEIQISINAASTSDLDELPGIGSVLADRIVRYREQEGEFRSLEELKRVKGIGDKLYEKILPHISLH
jgi:competence protein ComEA